MAGQQYRRRSLDGIGGQEGAHRRGRGHVQADCGLIEEQHPRAVQQRDGQPGPHPLAQAERPHLAPGQFRQSQQVG
jgi:hypothetical protein